MNPSSRQRRHHDRWIHYTTNQTSRGGSMNPSSRQRRYHDRWVHYTTNQTSRGGSMNPSSRQRRHHDRWVHYTTNQTSSGDSMNPSFRTVSYTHLYSPAAMTVKLAYRIFGSYLQVFGVRIFKCHSPRYLIWNIDVSAFIHDLQHSAYAAPSALRQA